MLCALQKLKTACAQNFPMLERNFDFVVGKFAGCFVAVENFRKIS